MNISGLGKQRNSKMLPWLVLMAACGCLWFCLMNAVNQLPHLSTPDPAPVQSLSSVVNAGHSAPCCEQVASTQDQCLVLGDGLLSELKLLLPSFLLACYLIALLLRQVNILSVRPFWRLKRSPPPTFLLKCSFLN